MKEHWNIIEQTLGTWQGTLGTGRLRGQVARIRKCVLSFWPSCIAQLVVTTGHNFCLICQPYWCGSKPSCSILSCTNDCALRLTYLVEAPCRSTRSVLFLLAAKLPQRIGGLGCGGGSRHGASAALRLAKTALWPLRRAGPRGNYIAQLFVYGKRYIMVSVPIGCAFAGPTTSEFVHSCIERHLLRC